MLSHAQLPSTVTPAAERSGVLSRASGLLIGARTLDDVRDRLAAVVAGLYARRARLELYVLDGEKALVPASRRKTVEDRAARQLLASVRTRMLAEHQLLTDARVLAAEELPGRRSVMTAPVLDAAGELLGVAIVESEPDDPDFTVMELVALEGVAALASAALQRMGETGRVRARMELDRHAARTIQRGFMRCELPAGIGVSAVAEYLPAFDVGGDFYCVKHVAQRTVNIAIGDVSGNGISAALLMSRVTSDLERNLAANVNPGAILAEVHERLAGVASDMFVTASCARLDAARGRLTISNAGHLPLIVRRGGEKAFTCGGASGAPLGIGTGQWDEEELRVERGDLILLLTDGLLEALDPPSGHRGMELLVDLVQAAPHSPDRISDRIRAAVDDARRERALDDVTWVALQVTA